MFKKILKPDVQKMFSNATEQDQNFRKHLGLKKAFGFFLVIKILKVSASYFRILHLIQYIKEKKGSRSENTNNKLKIKE